MTDPTISTIELGGVAVKPTWVMRTIPHDLAIVWGAPQSPGIGAVMLCEVVRTGIHGRVETADGARMKMYAGDRIACVVGNRYATSLLEAIGSVDGDRIDLVSASGVCGRVLARSRDAGTPTKLRVIGQAFTGGVAVNVRDYQMQATHETSHEPRWIVVVGSAMDSGKTTACASLIRGLAVAGHRVGAAKITGTASARDFGSFRDAGARPVIDFLDGGWASTAGCDEEQLIELLDLLSGTLRAATVDWAVLEIADGLLQPETNILLTRLRAHLHQPQIVLTVNESLAAIAGVRHLHDLGHHVSAISGVVTNSPLARREIELAVALPCVATSDLGRRFADGSLGEFATEPAVMGPALV